MRYPVYPGHGATLVNVGQNMHRPSAETFWWLALCPWPNAPASAGGERNYSLLLKDHSSLASFSPPCHQVFLIRTKPYHIPKALVPSGALE